LPIKQTLSPHIYTKLIYKYFKYAQEPQGAQTFVVPPIYRLNRRSRAREGIDKKQTCSFFDIFQRSQNVANTIGLTYRMFIRLGVRKRDCLIYPLPLIDGGLHISAGGAQGFVANATYWDEIVSFPYMVGAEGVLLPQG